MAELSSERMVSPHFYTPESHRYVWFPIHFMWVVQVGDTLSVGSDNHDRIIHLMEVGP